MAKKTAKKAAAESPAALVIRKAYYARVDVVDLAEWLGINQATLHRWKDASTFERATGHAAELVRRMAKHLDLVVTSEIMHYCRLAAKERGGMGAFCAIANYCWSADQKNSPLRKSK